MRWTSAGEGGASREYVWKQREIAMEAQIRASALKRHRERVEGRGAALHREDKVKGKMKMYLLADAINQEWLFHLALLG